MKTTARVTSFAKGIRRRCVYSLAVLFVIFVLAACTAPEQVAEVAPDAEEQELLAFLVDGKTRKEDVLSRLGMPTGAFEGERILTHRMGLHSQRGFIPYYVGGLVVDAESVGKDHQGGGQRSPSPGWKGLYQIILVFDEEDVLEKHKIVKHKIY